MPEFIVVPDKKMPNLYVVAYDNGREVPDYLKGLFSTRIAAKKKVMFFEERPPKHQPQEYSGGKNITDEEEEALFEKVKLEVAEKNRGKEEGTKEKSKGGTKRLRKGADNGG